MFVFKKHPSPGLCKVRACRKKRRKRGQICEMHSKRQWRARNPVLAAYLNLKHHAKQRGISFSLSTEDWEEFVEKTAYCDRSGRTKLCFHVDRKESWRGYERGNIQVLTCSENSGKDNRPF